MKAKSHSSKHLKENQTCAKKTNYNTQLQACLIPYRTTITWLSPSYKNPDRRIWGNSYVQVLLPHEAVL